MTTTSQLRREADSARVGLADTLSQLRQGVTPGELSGEALALAKDTGLSLIKSLSDQARANPVPALLIGAGLVMLLTRTTGGDVASAAGTVLKSAASSGADAARQAASAAGHAMKGAASAATGAAASAATAAGDAVLDTAERTATSVGQKLGAVRERVSGQVEAAGDQYAAMREKMHEAADQGRRALHDRQDQAAGVAHEARDRAQVLADETRQSLKHLLEEQPILMAALGAALGAAVGAALPLSRQESELLGGVGASAVGAGRDALSNAADVLREEVAHADLGGKASELADKVVQGVANGGSRS